MTLRSTLIICQLKPAILAKDFDTLSAAGNNDPQGIWSDETTMWVADYQDDSKIYAYNLSTKARDSSKDLAILSTAGNNNPTGIWSDGTTMWVADTEDTKLYAYIIPAHDSSSDFGNLMPTGNTNITCIYSDNTTMWVADTFDGKLYAYKMSDKTRDASKDFNTLAAAGNNSPSGIWADDTTMWVADDQDDKIYAYNATTKSRDSNKDFTSLSAAGNTNPIGIWSDETTMWVVDSGTDKIYAYTISSKARDSSKDFNTLSAANNNNPTGIWSDETTMWVADDQDDKVYAYKMSDKDRDSSRDFNTLYAANNNNPTGIWSDGTSMWIIDSVDDKIYAYSSSYVAGADPTGLWVDESTDTVYVADSVDDKIHAYELHHGGRKTSLNISLSAIDVTNINGITGDGTNLWIAVTHNNTYKLYAYTISSRARDSSKDITLPAGTTSITGVTNDGTTIWAGSGNSLIAYNISSTNRDNTKDFADTVFSGAGNNNISSIFTDGTTMWVADPDEEKIFAYDIETQSHDTDRDLLAIKYSGNINPGGMCLVNSVMLVLDTSDDRIYAYNFDTEYSSSDSTSSDSYAANNSEDQAFGASLGNDGIRFAWSGSARLKSKSDLEDYYVRIVDSNYVEIGRFNLGGLNPEGDITINNNSFLLDGGLEGLFKNAHNSQLKFEFYYVVNELDSDSLDGEISELNYDRYYQFRLRAKNYHGVSDWSYTTLPTLYGTPADITGLSVDARNSDSLVISWDGDADDTTWGNRAHLRDRYRGIQAQIVSYDSDGSPDYSDAAIISVPLEYEKRIGEVVITADADDIFRLRNSRTLGIKVGSHDAAGTLTGVIPADFFGSSDIPNSADRQAVSLYTNYSKGFLNDNFEASNKPLVFKVAGSDASWRTTDWDDYIVKVYADDDTLLTIFSMGSLTGNFSVNSSADTAGFDVLSKDLLAWLDHDSLVRKLVFYEVTNPDRYSFDNLDTDTNYGIRIRRYNGANYSANWTEITDTTREFTADDPGLIAVPATRNRAGLSWTMPTNTASDFVKITEVGKDNTNTNYGFSKDPSYGVIDADHNILPLDLFSESTDTEVTELRHLLPTTDNDTPWGITFGPNSVGDRLSSSEFDLSSNNTVASGATSYGDFIYVADTTDDKIYAYNHVSKTYPSHGTYNSTENWSSLDSGNTDARYMWAGPSYLYVLDDSGDEIYAYLMSTKESEASLNIDLHSDNTDPKGIWSDGETMWVVDNVDNKIYAYALLTGTRDSDKDISLHPDNGYSRGIWSDGETMWVADSNEDKLFAYNMEYRLRDPDKDFDTLSGAGNSNPSDIYSNGYLMWVLDSSGDKVYAYNLETKARVANRDVTLDSNNSNAYGLCSDGVLLLVSDSSDDEIYAYDIGYDIDFTSNNADPKDITTDGEMIWVVDGADTKLYAYDINTGEYSSTKDIDLHSDNASPVGLVTDKTTIWVLDSTDDKLYAYDIATASRDSDKDINTLSSDPSYASTDGTFLWVLDATDDRVYVYELSTGNWLQHRDISLNSNNSDPAGISVMANKLFVVDKTGDKFYVYQNYGKVLISDPDSYRIYYYDYCATTMGTRISSRDITATGTYCWSDGKIMFVLNSSEINAYNLITGTAITSRDITLDSNNADPTGIWSDGTTMWVADNTDDKLYGYNLSSGSRNSDKDLTLISNNGSPRGMWSDGTTVYISDDGASKKVYAYDLTSSDFGRVTAEEFDLDSGNADPKGMWSDGTTMWIADGLVTRIFAYNLIDKTRNSYKDLVTHTDNADPNGVWSNGSSLWISDTTNNKLYAYSMPSYFRNVPDKTTVRIDEQDGTAVKPKAIYDDGDNTYVIYESDSTVRCYYSDTGLRHDSYDIILSASNSSPEGLYGAGNYIWVADSGTPKKLYAYEFNSTPTRVRYDALEFPSLDSNNASPAGIFSDGTTMWVCDNGAVKIFGYNMATKARDSDQDFDTLSAAGNTGPRGLWSDGETMWVSENAADKIYAYNISTKAHDSDKDFDTLSAAGNHNAYGLWSDGTTMWVSDDGVIKIFAYNMETKERDSDKDFETLDAANNDGPRGMWSDGINVWVADPDRDRVYAYNLNDKTRVPDLDFASLASAGNEHARGLWSDGEYIWVGDRGEDKIFCYTFTLYHYGYDSSKDIDLTTANAHPRGITSDGTTIWVADANDTKLYAYKISDETYDSSKDINLITTNQDPKGLDNDGTNIYSIDQNDGIIYSYSITASANANAKERNGTREFTDSHTSSGSMAGAIVYGSKLLILNTNDIDIYDTAGSGSPTYVNSISNVNSGISNFSAPEGLWTDGTDLFITDKDSAILFAFTVDSDLTTLTRNSSNDINTGFTTNKIRDVWCSEDTIWIGEDSTRQLRAYTRSSRARAASSDIDASSEISGSTMRGIWSDGTIMWIGDSSANSLLAYALSDGSRSSSNDFTSLASTGTTTGADNNDDLWGIASDGVTMWVTDTNSGKVFAYRSAVAYHGRDSHSINLPAINHDASGIYLTWTEGTLKTMEALQSHEMIVYADSGSELARFNLGGLGELYHTIYIGDDYYVRTLDLPDLFKDYESNGLQFRITGTNLSITGYQLQRKSESGSYVDISGSSLSSDVTYFLDPQIGYVRNTRSEFNTLSAASNTYPRGIWSDGETMWVADDNDNIIYAYDIYNKSRHPDRDFDALSDATNNLPQGIWSDGTTMWVTDLSDDKLYAYKMSDKSYDSSKDFDTLSTAGNTYPRGIWSDETTMWVADSDDNKIYAYKMSDTSRDPDKDFNTLSAAGNNDPRGIWSDGETMWVADDNDGKIYAYNMTTKARDSAKDFTTLGDAGNGSPWGIWSDGITMWVVDYGDDKLYAYNMETPALIPGVAYTYRIRAKIHGLYGDWSNEDLVIIVDATPDSIDNLTAVVEPNQAGSVSLYWTEPYVGDIPNIAGYYLEIYDDSNTWEYVESDTIFLGTIVGKLEFRVGKSSSNYGYGDGYGALLLGNVDEIYFNGTTLTIDGLPNTLSSGRAKILINDSQIKDVSRSAYSNTNNDYDISNALTSSGQAKVNDKVTVILYSGSTEVSLSSSNALIPYGSAYNPYVVDGLSNNTEYKFRIYPVNSYGVGSVSNEATATTLSSAVPDAPTILSYKFSSSSIVVDWAAPSYVGTDSITEYYIYWTVNSATRVTSQRVSTASTSYTVNTTNVSGWASTANATTRLWITSKSSAGESPVPIDPIIIKHVAPPGIPTNLAGTVNDTQITLVWQLPSSSASQTGYSIIRSTVADNELYQEVIEPHYTKGTSYVDTDLEYSTTYYYKIASVNDGGLSNYTSELAVTTDARDNSQRRPDMPVITLQYSSTPKKLSNGKYQYTRISFTYYANIPAGSPPVEEYEIIAGDYPYLFQVNAGASWTKSITVRARNSNGWGPVSTKQVTGTAPSD